MKVQGVYPARYVSNYDGDSLTIQFCPWPKIWVESDVRLGGIDTPEFSWRAKCEHERELGEKAKTLVYLIMAEAKDVQVRIYKKGKYGRLLVDIIADDKDLASELLKAGLARPYHGGKRKGWCDD